MTSSEAHVVPKQASAHLTAVGTAFSLTQCLFRSGSRPCPADAPIPMNTPYTIRNAWGIKGHCWPPLLTCSTPADCMSQKVSSCEAMGPGQPLLAVVTEWEHAVLSLLAPLLGAQSMCYNNKPKNPDHTLPYLKIYNENIWSKCIQLGKQAESHALTEFLIVTLRHDPFALWIQTSHVLEKKQQPEDEKNRSCLWDQPAVHATFKSLGFHSTKKPPILSSRFIRKLTQLLWVWLFSFGSLF